MQVNISSSLRFKFLMLFILVFVFCHWYFSLFTLTFLHHRYASHAVFSMSKPWERVFYLLAYVAQGSAYVSPRTFAILHRMHHAYTDTEKGPVYPVILLLNKVRIIKINKQPLNHD